MVHWIPSVFPVKGISTCDINRFSKRKSFLLEVNRIWHEYSTTRLIALLKHFYHQGESFLKFYQWNSLWYCQIKGQFLAVSLVTIPFKHDWERCNSAKHYKEWFLLALSTFCGSYIQQNPRQHKARITYLQENLLLATYNNYSPKCRWLYTVVGNYRGREAAR